jgi:hypothetical protein
MATAESGPHLATDKNSAGSTAPVPSTLKRKASGHGTASGQYKLPYPTAEIWHEQFATPIGNRFTGDTTTFEVELPEKTVGR